MRNCGTVFCQGIAQAPQQRRGRPSHTLCDAVFAATSKVYSTVSGRRAMHDLEERQHKGYLTRKLSYNSIFDYLENPELTRILKTLIEQSASPLRAVETDFAVDSSGFATNTYSRWFDHKYGRERSRRNWVKTHLACGVHTHVVTAVEATPFESADAPQLPTPVNQTAKTFDINEVSADRAYSTRKNLHAVQAAGGTAFIPFKSYSRGSQGNKPFDGLWARMWHFYNFNRQCFLQHYHQRSNVETAFSMIKAKFGASVRSKTPTAQVNEVLCKVLAHNICCLVQRLYELGIQPNFWRDGEPHETPTVAALDVRPWN